MMNREKVFERLQPTPDNKKSVVSIFMNWHNLEVFLDKELEAAYKKKYPEKGAKADRKFCMVAGILFSVREMDNALKGVELQKRKMFYKHYVNGISQTKLAKSRKPKPVSQALIQWEIDVAKERILDNLAEIYLSREESSVAT